MTEYNFTQKCDKRIAKLIDFLVANLGYEGAKLFIEMLAVTSMHEALERAKSTRAKDPARRGPG